MAGSVWGDQYKFTPSESVSSITPTSLGNLIPDDTRTLQINASSFTLSNPKYFRFCLKDGDSEIAISSMVARSQWNDESGSLRNFGTKGFVYNNQWGGNWDSNWSFKITLPENYTSNYKLYCYISNEAGTQSGGWDGTVSDNVYTIIEPNITTAYEFSIKLISDLSFTLGAEPTESEYTTHTYRHTAKSSDTSTTIDLFSLAWDDSNLKMIGAANMYGAYVRWYLKKKGVDGIVATSFNSPDVPTPAYKSTPSGYTWSSTWKDYTNNDWKQGFVHLDQYNGNTPNWNDDDVIKKLLKVNVAAPAGEKITDYEAILLIYNSNEKLNLTEEGGYVTTEPNFKFKIIIPIDKDYASTLKSGASSTAKTYKVDVNAQNHTMADLSEVSNLTGTVYARLFASDAAGNILANQTETSGDLTFTMPTGWTYKEKYGWVYYGDASSLKLEQIQVATTLASLYENDNVKMSLVLSQTFTTMDPASPGAVADIVVEPEWDNQYIIGFEPYSYEGSLSSGSITSTDVVVKNGERQSRVITEWKDNFADIVSGLSSASGKIYARLFVSDKSSGALYADQSALSISGLSSGWTAKSDGAGNYGYVFYGDYSTFTAEALTGITVGSSNSLYNESATLSLLLSTDMTRMLPADAADATAIKEEPNWEKQYQLNFTKYIDPFLGSLKSGGLEKSQMILIDRDDTSVALTDLANEYSTIVGGLTANGTSGKVYARLYVADDTGDLNADQTLLTFSGMPTGWTKDADYGWIYYGDGFAESMLNGITVSSSGPLSAVGAKIGLVVSSDMTRLQTLSGSRTRAVGGIATEPDWEVKYLYGFSYPFAGTLSTSAFKHSKEIVLTTADLSAGKVTIPLNESFSKIKSEYVKTNSNLADNLHIRWYVTYNGSMIAKSEDYLAPLTTSTSHRSKEGYGIYWNSETNYKKSTYWEGGIEKVKWDPLAYPFGSSSTDASDDVKNLFNITFTKPTSGNWNDYKVVIWLSDNTSAANGQASDYNETDGYFLTQEPNINMQYLFSFFSESEFRFVHSKGAAVEAYPELDYLTKTSTVQQYDWDNSTSTAVAATKDIRQGVHTVIYDVYMKPDGGKQNLKLPFEKYNDDGNNLEPAAYIRWYDWETDLGSDKLSIYDLSNSWLEDLKDFDTNNSRGLFALNRELTGQNVTRSKVGVYYDPADLTSTHVIACDVSKYYDGIYGGSSDDTRPGFSGKKHPYMLHEPTLSTRYLFRIHPANDIVKGIADAKADFDTHMANIRSTADGTKYKELSLAQKNAMYSLYEDNGRVVVSTKDGNSEFSLRANLPTLDGYFVGTESTPIQCSKMWWYSYCEDDDGLLYQKQLGNEATLRISTFKFSDMGGDYTLVSNSSVSKSISAVTGQRYHVIGYIGNSISDRLPVVHYELQFITAPAILMDDLTTKDPSRTPEYLNSHFKFGGKVNFDDYFTTTTLSNQNENHTEKPLPWDDAQYGFCYPQINQYRIATGASGLTPIHGDYILLKSMGGTYSGHMDLNQPYEYFFYRGAWGGGQAEMYDYTHYYGGDASKFGSFLYVDASDEARTIATLSFPASLCTGSQIYFTAAVADVTTDGATPPQLMVHVYGVDEHKVRTSKPIVSFLTCEMRSVAESTYQYVKWYQVYGYTTIPAGIDIDSYDTFAVEIDNYSKNTNGADYCVDEICFYTQTAKLTVEQEISNECTDSGSKLRVYVNASDLVDMFGSSGTVYWQVRDSVSNSVILPVLTDPDYYTTTFDASSMSSAKDKATFDTEHPEAENCTGFFKDEDGTIYFQLARNTYNGLTNGEKYYVSVYTARETMGYGSWGTPATKCSTYSSYFVPSRPYIDYEASSGNEGSEFTTNCGGSGAINANIKITMKLPDAQKVFTEVTGLKYDFYVGSLSQYQANTDLVSAWQDYRGATSSYKNTIGLDAGYESGTGSKYTALNTAVNTAGTGKLLLLNSEDKLQTSLPEGTTAITILPIDHSHYCPFEIAVTYTLAGSPTLTLGFDDVDYSTAGAKRVIRVGLEQLNKMRTQGYKLHIPVNSYSDKNQVMTNKLYFPTDAYLTISAVDKSATTLVPNTTDPTKPAIGTKFAKIVPNNSSDTRPSVDKDHMYISLDLSGENCAINFHEGYEYEVATTFVDENDENNSDACIGDLFLVIKVVPEFVTWHAQHVDDSGNPTATETDYWSANWYNDGNWQRSVRSDLYKDTKGSSQNTATKGHPNGYDDNGEGDLNSLTAGSNPGFVPMKFTYVTLPTGNNAPSLINEPRVVGTGKGAKRQGGGFLDLTRTTLLTDRSPNANTESTPLASRHNSKPTENIYYDMLVRYSKDDDDQYGEGCFGHRYLKSDGTWDDQGTEDLTARVFDVEKFQGNVCREIYFKPGAELLRPHRLQYEKAWVEMELDANKWYLASAPLKDTYAGDMYVPTSMTDVTSGSTVKGRQVTEAFQHIGFDKLKGYSRTQYPIYQRSWGNNNGTVYVMENDIRANSYSANLNFSTVTTNMLEWGHTYNDVQVPYSNLAGFSIRAHRKDQTDKVLIRLPKADTSYEYYDWSDTSSDPAAGDVKGVAKPNVNKLVSDYQDDTDTETSPLTFTISNMQQNGDYVLVGNPFMVSLDMKKFFETNSTLGTDGYWTFTAGAAEAHAIPTAAKTATGIIKPLQAFFVKKGTATQITFNKEMQIDGNFPMPPTVLGGARVGEVAVVTLKAVSEEGSSVASIVIGEEASDGYDEGEDVETLFDSNLSDVPMVFTVAGKQAVSIDQRPEIDVVSFGVSCAESNDLVEVTVDDSELALSDGQLYVLDAVTGDVTAVGEGSSVMVQPNDYGRYFLTTRGDLTAVKGIETNGGIVVSVRGSLVTVKAGEALTSVRALTTGGATVYSEADCGPETSFKLNQSGVYIIEAQTAEARKTVKIVVKN